MKSQSGTTNQLKKPSFALNPGLAHIDSDMLNFVFENAYSTRAGGILLGIALFAGTLRTNGALRTAHSA
jgi:hypothetical protein